MQICSSTMGVCVGCLWVPDIEQRGEFAIAVSDQESEVAAPITQIEHPIADLLGDLGGGRVRRDTQNMDTAGGVLDHGVAVQPGEQDRLCMEEVGGQDPFRLGFEELGPGRVAAARCRVESGRWSR
jgi:hypothetical protein